MILGRAIACRAARAAIWLAIVAPAAAAAQAPLDPRIATPQGAGAARGEIGIEQIGPARPARALETAPAAPVERSVRGAGQVSTNGDRSPPVQVGRDQHRSAGGAAALSARSDGRPLPAAAIGGADRCDPGRESAADSPLCRRVIERRAADYTAPAATPVSAEAALLATQDRAGSLADAVRAARPARTGAQSNDADDPASQELAAVVLAPPPPAPVPDVPVSAGDKSLGEILVEVITKLPPQP